MNRLFLRIKNISSIISLYEVFKVHLTVLSDGHRQQAADHRHTQQHGDELLSEFSHVVSPLDENDMGPANGYSENRPPLPSSETRRSPPKGQVPARSDITPIIQYR